MSSAIAVGLFLVLILVLGLIVKWEFSRRQRGPSISSRAFRSQLDDSPLPYVPLPEKTARSMDRSPRFKDL
jgi:hypothetical protein